MENKIYKAGERVEKFCSACNEQLGHMVKSVTKQGRISRVTCSRCGLLGTFKSSLALTNGEDSAPKAGQPYEQSKTYRVGQSMTHHSFGNGEVTSVFDSKTIDVLFTDRVRRLVHARTVS